MKIVEFSFKHKKQKITASYVEFDTFDEAKEAAGDDDLLRIYHLGARELAKQLATGKNPFTLPRRTLKIKLRDLSSEQYAALERSGLLDSHYKKPSAE